MKCECHPTDPSTSEANHRCSEIKTRPFNTDSVELIGKARSEVSPKDRPNNGKGIQTTTSIWSSAKFTRAVFSLQFDFGGKTPSKENNWLLEENPWLVYDASRKACCSPGWD
jgi:hypothetical protein